MPAEEWYVKHKVPFRKKSSSIIYDDMSSLECCVSRYNSLSTGVLKNNFLKSSLYYFSRVCKV